MGVILVQPQSSYKKNPPKLDGLSCGFLDTSIRMKKLKVINQCQANRPNHYL